MTAFKALICQKFESGICACHSTHVIQDGSARHRKVECGMCRHGTPKRATEMQQGGPPSHKEWTACPHSGACSCPPEILLHRDPEVVRRSSSTANAGGTVPITAPSTWARLSKRGGEQRRL
jgi:hypothetical protein